MSKMSQICTVDKTFLTFIAGDFLRSSSIEFLLHNFTKNNRKTETEIILNYTENQLSRCRTNHNVGVRVTSLKCAISGCPRVNRLLTDLDPPEDEHQYQLQEIEGQEHNHQAAVASYRGMFLAQKEVVRLCIERELYALFTSRLSENSTGCSRTPDTEDDEVFAL